MGTFTIRLEIGDLPGTLFGAADALVDTGAIYTLIPQDMLARLDVEQREIRQFALADESIVEYGLGYATLRFEEREVIAPIVFAPEGTMPLLGVTTLEIAGLGVDPVNERLIPVMGLLKPARDVPHETSLDLQEVHHNSAIRLEPPGPECIDGALFVRPAFEWPGHP